MKNTLYISTLPSPVDDLTIVTSDTGLCFVEFLKPDQDKRLQKKRDRHYPGYRFQDQTNDFSDLARRWLTVYFNEKRDPGIDIPMDIRGTAFEVKVWQALKPIPFGTTVSYKDIAERIGYPNSSRAVGGATGRNPVSIIIPCHRVVGSNGTLTGFGGGLDRKRFLLENEHYDLKAKAGRS